MITVTGKGKNGNRASQEVINDAIEYYTNQVYNGMPYLKAEDVGACNKDLEKILALCKERKAWHMALPKGIVKAIGGVSWQASTAKLNPQIKAYKG